MNLRSEVSAFPFSLISGQGLGVSHASLPHSFLPARAFGQADIKCAANMATGNLIIQDHALRFPNLDDAIELSYIYNSCDAVSPWRFHCGKQINNIKAKQSLHVIEADGHDIEYNYNAKDDYYYPSTYQEGKPVIRYDEENKTWNWTHPLSRKTECFDAQGLLIKSTDKSGNVTSYKYDDKGQLQTIIAASGVTYEIKRSNEKIDIYLDKEHPVLLHTYMLDADGNLKSSITPDQLETSYEYNQENKKIKEVVQSDGCSLKFKFNSDAKIQTLQIGSDETNVTSFSYEANKTIFKDASSAESTLTYDNQKQPLSFKNDDSESRYGFNLANQIEKITYPDQSEETFEYVEKTGLLIRQTHRDGASTVFRYSDETSLLIEKTDYEKSSQTGKQTRYVYDEKFKGKHAVLRYEISACGRVKEFIRNEFGQTFQEQALQKIKA